MYATQNLTAKKHFDGWDEDGLEHTGSVPAVSWWKVGKVVNETDLYDQTYHYFILQRNHWHLKPVI